jgi:hypothetical protein
MKNLFFKNTLKAITILLSAYILFFLLIIMFPAFGSLIAKGISMKRIFYESMITILPALIVIIPFSLILGWMSTRLKKRRLIVQLLTGILIYLISIFVAIISQSGISILNEGAGTLIIIVLWAFLAYFIFVVPLLVLGIIILERWTR